MATRVSGGVTKATDNTVTAMRNSAERRQCPDCGRKSALVRFSDDLAHGQQCRWPDCGYWFAFDRETGAKSERTR